MLVFAWIAWCLGVAHASLWLGLFLLLLSVPAMFRTQGIASRERERGRPIGTGLGAAQFVGSLCIELLAILIAGIFFAQFYGMFGAGSGRSRTLVLVLGATSGAAVWLLIRTGLDRSAR
jgi:hypothetical protein